MITAKEAREGIEILGPSTLDRIYFNIEKASKCGENNISLYFRNNIDLDNLFRVRDDLVESGYIVTIKSEAIFSKNTIAKKLHQLKVEW